MSDWRSDPNGFNEAVISEFRANGGVVGGELADMPLLLLTTIDARSGQPRTTPLAYHRRGNRYLVIASNGGAARNPAWFRNLERDPDVTVEVGVETLAATARILDGSERDAAFAAIVAEAPSAGAFQAKAGRTIPVIELEPQRNGDYLRVLSGSPSRQRRPAAKPVYVRAGASATAVTSDFDDACSWFVPGPGPLSFTSDFDAKWPLIDPDHVFVRSEGYLKDDSSGIEISGEDSTLLHSSHDVDMNLNPSTPEAQALTSERDGRSPGTRDGELRAAPVRKRPVPGRIPTAATT